MATLAVAAYGTVVIHLPPTESPLHLPWPAWAAAFAAAEALVVHVQARRDSYSFSVTDMVLVAALCLAQPLVLLTAHLSGTGPALLLHRRQSGLKLMFNLALAALADCGALIVFAGLSGGAAWSSPRAWVGALGAVAVSTLVSDLCTFAVIALSEGAGSLRHLRGMLRLSLLFALGAGAVGLLLVRTALLDPMALVLLAPPSALMIAAYRAYAHARRQQDNLRLLHEVTSLLHDSDTARDGLGNFLTAVRTAFRGGLAELVLLDDAGSATVTRGRDGQDAAVLLALHEDDDLAELLRSALRAGLSTTRTGSAAPSPLDDYVAARGVKDAVLSVLRTDERVYGLLLVAGRLGEVATFTDSDCALLDTFARHVATSLERGRLQSDLRYVTELQEKLRHQALHDALTGLPNRTLFLDRAQNALRLASRTHAWPAVLYLDLDGFKPINDTHGHEAGDQLLRVFAQRLRSCLRAADTAARLGGDEFAILVNGPIDADGIERVVERIRHQLAVPVDLGAGRQATIGASIGITIAGADADTDTEDVETLLRQADAAMYAAKRAHDGRHVFHHDGPGRPGPCPDARADGPVPKIRGPRRGDHPPHRPVSPPVNDDHDKLSSRAVPHQTWSPPTGGDHQVATHRHQAGSSPTGSG